MDYTCGIFIFWAICGLIAAYLYKNKGRSQLSGFLGGFILGPIGIVLALLTPDDKVALKKRDLEAENDKLVRGEAKKCPFCAELIKPEAKVCRYCGKELPEDNLTTKS